MTACCALTVSVGSCIGCSAVIPPDPFPTPLCALGSCPTWTAQWVGASCFPVLLELANGTHQQQTGAGSRAGWGAGP